MAAFFQSERCHVERKFSKANLSSFVPALFVLIYESIKLNLHASLSLFIFLLFDLRSLYLHSFAKINFFLHDSYLTYLFLCKLSQVDTDLDSNL